MPTGPAVQHAQDLGFDVFGIPVGRFIIYPRQVEPNDKAERGFDLTRPRPGVNGLRVLNFEERKIANLGIRGRFDVIVFAVAVPSAALDVRRNNPFAVHHLCKTLGPAKGHVQPRQVFDQSGLYFPNYPVQHNRVFDNGCVNRHKDVVLIVASIRRMRRVGQIRPSNLPSSNRTS